MGLLSDLKEKLNQETTAADAEGMEKPEHVTRLFFATDIHGSTVCWRKFVNAADFYDADVLVLGGDTTGKAIFPIIDRGDTWTYTRGGEQTVIDSEAQLEDERAALENRGYYPIVLSASEYEALQEADDREERQDEIFEREMIARIREWTDLAESRLPPDYPVYVCPGNDDPFVVDEVWQESELVELVEGEVVEIDEHYEMLSTGWTNPSPWDTPREESEAELRERLERIVDRATAPEWTVFNVHDPPYDSQLDEAPELDDERRPKFGGQTTEPVGSTAVRKVIEEYQPPLSLHGHIHESRGKTEIGETVAINPGSVYSEGSLQGAIVDLHPEVDVVGLVRG